MAKIDTKTAALVSLLVALTSLVTAATQYLQAKTAEIEKQKVLDNYRDYILEQMKAGCN